MPTTVFLCRWNRGWSEVSIPTRVTTYGRREAMLSLGAQQSIQEVVRLATAELSGLFAKNREQMTVEHHPQSLSETPYVGYKPSDRVTVDDFDGDSTTLQVLSMTVTEDDDGQLSFVPVIGDIIAGVEALQEALRVSAERKYAARKEWRPPNPQ